MPKLRLHHFYRVVVVGDRSWPDDGFKVIKEVLKTLPGESLVITGKDTRGVSIQADLAAHILKLTTITVPQEPEKYGKLAPTIRNVRLLEEYKPDLLLAFYDHKRSPVVEHCVALAKKRKIPVEELELL